MQQTMHNNVLKKAGRQLLGQQVAGLEAGQVTKSMPEAQGSRILLKPQEHFKLLETMLQVKNLSVFFSLKPHVHETWDLSHGWPGSLSPWSSLQDQIDRAATIWGISESHDGGKRSGKHYIRGLKPSGWK